MTAKEIIDRFVLPKAKFWGMTAGIDPQQVVEANGRHGGTEDTTMHKGNGTLQWAVDMSTGSTRPDDAKDNLASDLIMSFNLNPLADPLAKYGYINGNITNTWHKGFRWQLIYRTDLEPQDPNSGDHYNHVHLGLRRESQFEFPH
jgi:hypothetical protein